MPRAGDSAGTRRWNKKFEKQERMCKDKPAEKVDLGSPNGCAGNGTEKWDKYSARGKEGSSNLRPAAPRSSPSPPSGFAWAGKAKPDLAQTPNTHHKYVPRSDGHPDALCGFGNRRDTECSVERDQGPSAKVLEV